MERLVYAIILTVTAIILSGYLAKLFPPVKSTQLTVVQLQISEWA